jgi:choline monooxygenase
MQPFFVDPNIALAETLPAEFYRRNDVFEAMRSSLFPQSWQWIELGDHLQKTDSVFPFQLLPGFLSEPLFLTRQDATLKAFSNVCTHRGNILVHHPGEYKKLVCNYHGRRFDLEGKMEFMPEFKEAEGFPRACDHLHAVPALGWEQFAFVSLDPGFDFAPVLQIMQERVGFMPISQFRYAPELSRDYLVNAHWALYCDNYLEGFHIPFVHPDLNTALDYGEYYTELFEHCNLQVGIADAATPCFDLPKNHPDYGKRIAAYYFWVFPNMMFNFYPWGLSVNLVKPLSVKQCKVSFILYVYDETLLDSGAGAALDKVEREDEFVVENVQRGLQSRFYERGRFSPKREQGVHHFHRLLCEWALKNDLQ